MRIGILTFHSALNYGAVLQTWASVRFLQSLGHEVHVLDYENPLLTKIYSPLRWDRERLEKEGLKYVFKWPVLVFRRLTNRRGFLSFRRRELPIVPFSRATEMDVLLVGSDQVWNKTLTGGADPVYFGAVAPGVKKLAWAASAGKAALSPGEVDRLRQNFAAIGVREQSLSALIPESVVLPDPVMLLTAGQWESLVRPVKGSYLLVYPMLYKEEVLEKARALSKELNLEMKVISPGTKLRSDWIQTASPDEFVSLFYHASYVVTSSFHGSVFTLLFNRPHTLVYHDDPRFETLLKTDFSQASALAEGFLAKHL